MCGCAPRIGSLGEGAELSRLDLLVRVVLDLAVEAVDLRVVAGLPCRLAYLAQGGAYAAPLSRDRLKSGQEQRSCPHRSRLSLALSLYATSRVRSAVS